ncbi:MAG: DUF4139 domain-containing protein, partial [Calditrichia bacterium]
MKSVVALFIVSLVLLTASLYADDNYVTVYNENLALVKQVRSLEIKKGTPLKFTDVAAQLIPSSVHLRAANGDKNFQVLEQNFEYDLVSADKILEKYVDHPVSLIRENGELVNGTLLSKSASTLVLKTSEGIKLIPWNDKTSVDVKELPEGLITRPTLIWDVTGVAEGKEDLEVSYLTNGMSWSAEYVGVLNENSGTINLDSWVSVDNKCGATFNDAHLKLVAGEVHRAPSAQPQPKFGRMALESAAAPPQFEERGLFEYHIYDLGRPTTLKNNQTKQISLFQPATVKFDKKYFYDASQDPTKVEVRIVFRNDKAAGLGMALPAGIFRIYQKDKEGLEFIGEDRIDHTPRNEEVKATVGNAFDLVGERTVVDRKKLSERSEQQTIGIELRNNKEKENVNITVVEYMYRTNWKITE